MSFPQIIPPSPSPSESKSPLYTSVSFFCLAFYNHSGAQADIAATILNAAKEKSFREVSNWQLNTLALITCVYNAFVRKSHRDLANQKGSIKNKPTLDPE